MFGQINGFQLSLNTQTKYLMLDQINGYQLSAITTNQLSCVGPIQWISAVKPIILKGFKHWYFDWQAARDGKELAKSKSADA